MTSVAHGREIIHRRTAPIAARNQPDDAELLARVEPPHAEPSGELIAHAPRCTIDSRQSAFVVSNQNVAKRSVHVAGPLRRCQVEMKFGQYCSAPAAAIATAIAMVAGAKQRARLRRDLQEKNRERHQQQNHREVIAERECIDREKDRQPAPGRPRRVRVQRQATREHERQVQRVDLRDDRLAPERVGEREQQRRPRCRRRRSVTSAHRKVRRPTAAAPNIAEKRFRPRAGLPTLTRVHKRPREAVVERIGLPRADLRPQHGGLKSSGVTEIDAGQQCLRVGPEGERCDEAAATAIADREPLVQPSAAAACAAINARTSSTLAAFST